MKYSGTVTILDEEGNTVHERELTSDQLIDELLFGKTAPEVKEDEEEAPATQQSAGKKKRKERTCSNCHKPGHIARHCPKANGLKDDDEDEEELKKDGDVLSTAQFSDVKGMQAKERNALEVSNEMDVPLREVNAAFASPHYMGYVKNRRRT